MDWTAILKKAGIPEPPGYRETVERIRASPYVKPIKKQRPNTKKKP